MTAQSMAGLENARGYSARMAAKAREHHRAGWKPSEIPRLIRSEFGLTPASTTVRRWVDPKYAARQAAWNRSKAASKSQAYRQRVLTDLRGRGLSVRALGQVSAVLWGEELSAVQVRTRLEGRRGYSKGART